MSAGDHKDTSELGEYKMHKCTCGNSESEVNGHDFENPCYVPGSGLEQIKFEELLSEQDLVKPKKFNYEKMVKATEAFLDALGHPDWRNDPNTAESPQRVAKMWGIILGGYDLDTKQYAKTFPATSDNAVFSVNNPIFSICSHHFMPFVGTISMAYIPDGKVIGLSKLPRIARAHSKKLSLQENLTKEIAEDIERILKPKGVAVQIRANHFCQSLRGVASHGAITVTTHVSGLFKTDPMARNEFLETIKVDPNVFAY